MVLEFESLSAIWAFKVLWYLAIQSFYLNGKIILLLTTNIKSLSKQCSFFMLSWCLNLKAFPQSELLKYFDNCQFNHFILMVSSVILLLTTNIKSLSKQCSFFTLRWCLNLKALPQSEHLNRLRIADSSWEIMWRWRRYTLAKRLEQILQIWKKNILRGLVFWERVQTFFVTIIFSFCLLFPWKACLCLCFCYLLFVIFFVCFCILDFGSIPSFHHKVWNWIL